MTTFFCIPALDFSGQESQFTIATGPVVVSKDHTKILLHIGESTLKWQFIGGRYDDTMTFRESAIAHAQKEIGDTEITLVNASHPIVILDTIDLRGYEEKTLLIHYEATIADEDQIGKSKWFTLEEIMILDAKNETSSSNVRIVAEKILGTPQEHTDGSTYMDPSAR